MTQKYQRRYLMYRACAIASFLMLLITFSFSGFKPDTKVQVYKGDIVKFKWTPDNVFYSKICTDYGTAIDQYGDGHSTYKVMIVCAANNKVEFVSLLIQSEYVVSSSQDHLYPIDDLLE